MASDLTEGPLTEGPIVPPPVHPGEACTIDDCRNPAIVKRLRPLAWYGYCFLHDPEPDDLNYCGDCGQSPCQS